MLPSRGMVRSAIIWKVGISVGHQASRKYSFRLKRLARIESNPFQNAIANLHERERPGERDKREADNSRSKLGQSRRFVAANKAQN